MAATEIVAALALGGLMGMIGQGVRAAVGLKKLSEESAAKGLSQDDLFITSRLLFSLFIGFVAGVIAALTLGIQQLVAVTATDLEVLLGLAAAGYAGTDIIEGFIPRIATPVPVDTGKKPEEPQDHAPPPADADLEFSLQELRGDVAAIRTALDEKSGADLRLSGPAAVDELAPVAAAAAAVAAVTPELVKRMFVPATPLSNIRKHLPNVLAGLRQTELSDRNMLLMALSTIRAETEGFVPISEFVGSGNTVNQPFDRYEPGTPKGRRLGNTQPGDGKRFRGRGFIQLTGRDNYTRIGGQIGVNLRTAPEQANDTVIAGRILAQFLKNQESAIRAALRAGNLAEARKLVNGGTHGFARFKDAFDKGKALLPVDETLDA